MSQEALPTVSIVMAAYNAGAYIEQAIASIIAQTYSNFEILIVNDGSTDNTDAVVEKFHSDRRVRYIRQANAGQTAAKNKGIKESQGTFIAFCDADDFWHPEKLAKQLLKFDDERVGVVYSDIQSVNSSGEHIKTNEVLAGKAGDLLNELLFYNFIPFGTAIIRSSCLAQNGGFNEQYRMGIDWDLWLRISVNWHFAFVPEKLYFYREWEGQMSRNYNGRYVGAQTILKNFYLANSDKVRRSLYRQAVSDIYANYAYHISLYEGYNSKLFTMSGKALLWGFDRKATILRVARALLRRF